MSEILKRLMMTLMYDLPVRRKRHAVLRWP
jgi:hypothetical protein